MAQDFDTGTYSETDASNNSASPNGMPEGMAPSGVNDAGRTLMGASKRAFDRDHAGAWCTVGGTANAITLTYTTAPTAYIQGQKYAFKATAANTSTTTANVNALGVKNVFKKSASGAVACTGGEIQSGDLVELEYDGTQFQILGTVTTISTAGLATGGPITGAGTITVTASSKAQMQTGTDNATAATPARVNDHDGVAKAWVLFDGTQASPITPSASFNVSGTITKSSTGVWVITWATAFATANYAVFPGAHLGNNATVDILSQTASAVTITAFNVAGAAVDLARISIAAYGRQ